VKVNSGYLNDFQKATIAAHYFTKANQKQTATYALYQNHFILLQFKNIILNLYPSLNPILIIYDQQINN